MEFFVVELPIKIQAQKIIAEGDLLRHLELLREVIRRGEVIACHSIIKQRAQRAGPIRNELAEPFEIFAGLCSLLGITGVNLQRREIELVEFILWFFLYSRGELFLLFGKVSFRRSQPAGNNMKGSPFTILRRSLIERFSRQIKFSKTQCRGNEIKLTIRISWAQSRNLFAP